MASENPAEMTLNDEQVAIQRDYDNFPYESYPFSLSHPQHLSMLASLFGMQAAGLENCRVLELGCGSGGNLIPIAQQFPKSQFFGIDLSSKQVERAANTIKQLKLKNIKIEHKDILQLDGKIRKFDYIICHGVYSYVPRQVQEKILQVAKRYLNENGIVFVSYNTYPGWHMRESVRDMMRFHTQNLEDPKEKVVQARALVKFLVDSVNTENNPYGQYLKAELNILSRTSDAHLLHEHLERNNKAIYFHEFCQQADTEGLQYLSEAEFHTMLASNFPPEVFATLSKIQNNLVQQEQYMDFLRNRTFRASLLCHKEVQLSRTVNADVVKTMHISAVPMWAIKSEQSEQTQEQNNYLSQAGMQIRMAAGLTQVAYKILSEHWPMSIAFDDLYAKAVEQSGAGDSKQQDMLANDLLSLFTAKAIELHSVPAAFQVEVSDKPQVSELARLQAENSYSITNMRHEVARINEPTRRLMLLLDGTSNHEQLLEQMLEMVAKGELILKEDEVEITDDDKQHQYIQQFLQKILQELGKRALLVS